MNKNDFYYTIIRKYYGLPDYLNSDLSEEEECFIFETEKEACRCIDLIFEHGYWMHDERYGKIRHYVERKKVKNTMYEY